MDTYSLAFGDRMVQSVLQRGATKFVLLSFKPGEELTKHRSASALTVIVLTGQIRFSVNNQTETLEAHEMLPIEPMVEHALEANVQSTVLLVLTATDQSTTPQKITINLPQEPQNIYQHPELMQQIAMELRPFAQDHMQIYQILESTNQVSNQVTIRMVLELTGQELNSHFAAEELFLFPRMAKYVGGMAISPVAQMLIEHKRVFELYQEAEQIKAAYDADGDEHTGSLLTNKVAELAATLLNHLSKEDSHLLPMASRILTPEERQMIASDLKRYGQQKA